MMSLRRPHKRSRHSGLTLVEAVGACLVAATLGVAVLRGVAAAGVTRATTADRAAGRQLADGLMSDILVLPYADPTAVLGIGIEVNELLSNKSTFDDVDDFDGWTESPPSDDNNATIPSLTGFTRTVTVKRVSTSDQTTTSLLETGLKRITVTVTKNGKVLATRVALRSNVSN